MTTPPACRHCGHQIHQTHDSPTGWRHYLTGNSCDWWACWAPGRNPLTDRPNGATP